VRVSRIDRLGESSEDKLQADNRLDERARGEGGIATSGQARRGMKRVHEPDPPRISSEGPSGPSDASSISGISEISIAEAIQFPVEPVKAMPGHPPGAGGSVKIMSIALFPPPPPPGPEPPRAGGPSRAH